MLSTTRSLKSHARSENFPSGTSYLTCVATLRDFRTPLLPRGNFEYKISTPDLALFFSSFNNEDQIPIPLQREEAILHLRFHGGLAFIKPPQKGSLYPGAMNRSQKKWLQGEEFRGQKERGFLFLSLPRLSLCQASYSNSLC